jgi:hypothetical protein
VAGLMLTTNVVITDLKDDKEENAEPSRLSNLTAEKRAETSMQQNGWIQARPFLVLSF